MSTLRDRHNEEKRSFLPSSSWNEFKSKQDNASLKGIFKSQTMTKRELLAWVLVLFESMILLQSYTTNTNTNSNAVKSMLTMNDHPPEYYVKDKSEPLNASSYDNPIVHPKDAGLVSRVWHSNSHPSINPGLTKGSCWCSADEWCMCTPSLAIDTIVTSGDNHFWLVKRKDVGKYATMGGFVEVGETSEEAVARELKEEMNIDLPHEPILFGMYGDPLRDARRHTISAVYVINIPDTVVPKAGDDAAEVQRVSIDEIQHLDFFADHKTLLNDYISSKKAGSPDKQIESREGSIKRSICRNQFF